MSNTLLYVFPINIDIKFVDIIDIDLPKPILAKALRFRKIVDQNNYLAARWILYALTQKAGINVPFGDFKISANGKPFIPGFSSFNISHCNGMVVVALSDGDIGIDVENISRSYQLDNFTQIFSSKEIAAIEKYGENAFYYFWTLKEAVLKYTGEGMATLSILQQINQKNDHLVTHHSKDFNFKSFMVLESYILNVVRSLDTIDNQTFKTFKCTISNKNALVFEEADSLLFPFQFPHFSLNLP